LRATDHYHRPARDDRLAMRVMGRCGSAEAAVARAFPIAWLMLLVVFDVSHGKAYYLSAIYPLLLALGAVRIEERILRPLVRGAALASVLAVGAVGAPLTLPILPVADFVGYAKALRVIPSAGENQKLGVLPQYYADMFGWQEMAIEVAQVYRSL